MERCIIVAIADNNAIGKNNSLLWHISEDLKFFRRTTVGSPVIMGRKTYDSIGRPLPGRKNIVITRGATTPDGTYLAHSLDEAFALAAVPSTESEARPEKCFVIGGGQIYAQALSCADRLVVTHVHAIIEDADTFFPIIDSQTWKEDFRSEQMTDSETGYTFEFVEYIRVSR